MGDNQNIEPLKYNHNTVKNSNLSISTSRSGLPLALKDEKEDTKSIESYDQVNQNTFWHNGELMQLVSDPLEELEYCPQVIVEQKVELLEVLSGCETPNRYHVYTVDKVGQKKYLFKCKEESSWGCRNCCPSSSREFNLKIIHIKSEAKNIDYKQTIAEFSRPFVCTCFCTKRPKLIGTYNNETETSQNQEQEEVQEKEKDKKTKQQKQPDKDLINSKPLGIISEEFSIGSLLKVFNESLVLKWEIKANCCQCGYCCRDLTLGKCYEVDFWIYNVAENQMNKTKEKDMRPIGNIHKTFKGISEMLTDADSFLLTFPKTATSTDKLMLIGAVLMIDYRYYEEKPFCNLSSFL